MLCPQCRAENTDGRRFCAACGASFLQVCPVCKFANEVDAKFCGGCGRPVALPPGPAVGLPQAQPPAFLAAKILQSRDALEGERKQVTVLLADLKSSLELLGDRDPEEARAILDPVLDRMIDAVHRFEGTVNQVMGDGIMALFGAPIAHEDHAVRAGYAALRMQVSIRALADQLQRECGVAPQIRIGLNAGEVVVRHIGNDLAMDYSAIGLTTHLAGRLEQLAGPGTILVTDAFVRLTEGHLHFKPLGLVPVRGLTEPVELFELVDAEPTRGRFQAAARGLTRFVGRSSEFGVLDKPLQRARAGQGQAVAVIGEPGVGKSRLFYEFIDSSYTRGCKILEASAVSYGKLNAYLPLRELLRTLFQIEDRDDARDVHAKVVGKITELDESLRGTLPALMAILDVPVDDRTWRELDPAQRRQRMFDGVKRLFIRLSLAQPLILMIENLHWIDAETQAFLDNLIESLPTVRILLLVNYRPEYQHRWGSKTYYLQLRLDPLPAESAEELLRVVLGDDHELGPLKRLLIERTEGNPFFLEECIRTLVETKVLVGQRGACRLGRALSAIQVPVTVQAILAARIDRLSPDDKRVLQCAAVIGRGISLPLLQAVAQTSEAELRQSLAHLQTAEFLYERSLFPELEYTFKHALTQEVAYATLLLGRRRDLHARIVQLIETLQADRLVDEVEHLAHHAFRGELWEKAVTYLRRAGAKALERSASRGAIAFFEQALEALEHVPEKRETIEQAIDVRLDLRRALVPLADRARILAHMQEAEALAGSLGDQRRLSWIAYGIAHCHYLAHEQERAVEAGQRALALSGGVDLAHEVAVNLLLGYSFHMTGDYRQAVQVLRRNIDMLAGDRVRERFGLPIFPTFPAVTSRERLARCLGELGEFAEGIRVGEEGMRIAEELDHAPSLTAMCLGLGTLHMRREDLDRASVVLERGLAIGRRGSIYLYVFTVAAAMGRVYVLTGRVAEGLALMSENVKEAESKNAALGHPLRLAWLAEGHLVAGEYERAWAVAQNALDLSRRYKEKGQEAWTLHLLGEIAGRRDPTQVEGAARFYQHAMTMADPLGMRPALARCRLGLGELHARAGHHDAAREHFAVALALFREMGLASMQERVEQQLGEPA
jgi:class 3 adenylate cyclase/tetratricopeptide (TPR) repeat protein